MNIFWSSGDVFECGSVDKCGSEWKKTSPRRAPIVKDSMSGSNEDFSGALMKNLKMKNKTEMKPIGITEIKIVDRYACSELVY